MMPPTFDATSISCTKNDALSPINLGCQGTFSWLNSVWHQIKQPISISQKLVVMPFKKYSISEFRNHLRSKSDLHISIHQTQFKRNISMFDTL